MNNKLRARIIGTGSFVPPKRMINNDFTETLDTSDEWIYSHTGIRERIIVGTSTSDYRMPSTACVIQEKLNLPNAAAFDVVSACAGFLNGLIVAKSFIESGTYKNIIVVGSEKLSSVTNYDDRNTSVLFGDGAGVLSSFIKSDGTKRKLLWIPVGGVENPYMPDFQFDGSDKLQMNGPELYRLAVREMYNASVKVIEDAGASIEDISLIVPHQANIRIIEGLAKRLKVNMDKVVVNIEKYGNTSSASIPLALDKANRAGRIKAGDLVLMVAFGGGLIWASALIKW